MSSQVHDQNVSQYDVNNKPASAASDSTSNKVLLSRYLRLNRWIWGLEDKSVPHISRSAIAAILDTLNK